MKIFAFVTIFALAFLGAANTSNAESLDRLAKLMVRKVKIQPPSKCLFNVSELMMELSSLLEVLDGADSRIQALEIKNVCEEICNKNCGSVSKFLHLYSNSFKRQLAFLSVFLALHLHPKSPQGIQKLRPKQLDFRILAEINYSFQSQEFVKQ